MKKVFIDGSAGTTGLRIIERLQNRKDIEILTLSEDTRKLAEYRKEALNNCDIAFLCLPDAAAKEAVSFIENKNVTIIDASTAHRTILIGLMVFLNFLKNLKKKSKIQIELQILVAMQVDL